MEKVLINSTQGESGIVNVVRYFLNNNKEYLIYSLNEVDESGYTRLYVTKLSGMNGVYTGEILDDNEWNDVKNLVKVIVKANKEGMPVPVQDLNPKKITNITLKDKKVFKLNAPLVNDLSNNSNYSEDGQQGMNQSFETDANQNYQMPSSPFDMPQTSQQDFGMSNMPSYELPQNQPSFDMPNTQNYDMPQPNQNYGVPSSSPFDIPQTQNDFNFPNSSSYEQQPNQPSFDIPNTQSYDIPNMNQGFDLPNTQNYEMPQPNQNYGIPSSSPFDIQNQNFGMTNTQYNMPQADSNFTIPNIPPYEPSTMNQGFDTTNNNLYGNTPKPTTDYKILYEEEMTKNAKLQEEINKLNDEISKYKSIVNNIKNVIE